MKVLNIPIRYLIFLIVFSIAIFVAGMFETSRNEGFDLVDEYILPANETPANIYADYSTFKSHEVFTNSPAIAFLNFMGLIGIFYMIYYSFKEGWTSREFSLGEIFTKGTLLFIIITFVIGVFVDYVKNIFIDQLIVILFEEIYSSIYTYQLLSNWFYGLILTSYILMWLANQLRHLDSFQT